MSGVFLDWALEAFSGYVAVDALDEGPYCVLSAVDNQGSSSNHEGVTQGTPGTYVTHNLCYSVVDYRHISSQ